MAKNKLQQMNAWRKWLNANGHDVRPGESYDAMKSRVRRLGGPVGSVGSASAHLDAASDHLDDAIAQLSRIRRSASIC